METLSLVVVPAPGSAPPFKCIIHVYVCVCSCCFVAKFYVACCSSHTKLGEVFNLGLIAGDLTFLGKFFTSLVCCII